MSHSSFSIFLSFTGLVDSTLLSPVSLVPTSIHPLHWILGAGQHFIILFCHHQIFSGTGGVTSRVLSISPSTFTLPSFLFLSCIPLFRAFPTSLVGEVTRLSEEGLSLLSLDLGEERVNENSHESSEIELRVWKWEKEGRGKGLKWARVLLN